MRAWLLRISLPALAVVAGLFAATRPAAAQDAAPGQVAPNKADARKDDSKKDVVRRIRELPADEKLRLKVALDRFRSLPKEQRDAIRDKASEIGVARLRELAGRDFAALQRKQASLRQELTAVIELLGEDRVKAMSPLERAWLHSEALRGFQRFCRTRLIEEGGFAPAGFDQLTNAEKHERLSKGVQAVLKQMYAEKTEEERARLRTATPAERAEDRAAMLREWRMRQTPEFARQFDGARLLPLLRLTPERRAAVLAKWQERARWFQVAGLLRTDGVSEETLKMLYQLGPEQHAQIAQLREQTKDLPAEDRRLQIESRIREMYGASAFDVERPRRPLQRVREVLREIRDRRNPPTDAAPAPARTPPSEGAPAQTPPAQTPPDRR